MSAPLYERATVSKALALTSIFCTLLVAYFDVPGETLLGWRRPALTATTASPLAPLPSSPWRVVQNVLLSQTAFRRIFPELALGLGVLYVFRHLERVLGSRKFFSFCLASSTLSLAMQIAALVLLDGGGGSPSSVVFTPGPFAPMFSLFVLYFWHVPALSFSLVNHYKYNSKLPVYGAGLFLATLEGRASLLPAALSVLAGVLVYSQLPRIDVPDAVARFGSRFIDPLYRQSEPPAERRRRLQRGGDNRFAQYGAANGGGFNDDDDDGVLLPGMFGGGVANAAANRGGPNQPPMAAVVPPPPREEDVLALVQMGFDVDAATEALRRNRNDVNRAADSLLFQQ